MALRFSEDHFSLGRKDSGRNIHVPLVNEADSSLWFGKISCPNRDMHDSNEREVIGTAIAATLGLAAPKADMVDLPTDISNFNELASALITFADEHVSDLQAIRWTEGQETVTWVSKLRSLDRGVIPWPQMVAVQWIPNATTIRNWQGQTRDLTNLHDVMAGVVFNVWYGNNDGNMDLNVLVDGDRKAWFVDFGYAGPCLDIADVAFANDAGFNDFGTRTDVSFYKGYAPTALIHALGLQTEPLEILQPMVEKIQSLSEADLRRFLLNTGCQFAFRSAPVASVDATDAVVRAWSRRVEMIGEKAKLLVEKLPDLLRQI